MKAFVLMNDVLGELLRTTEEVLVKIHERLSGFRFADHDHVESYELVPVIFFVVELQLLASHPVHLQMKRDLVLDVKLDVIEHFLNFFAHCVDGPPCEHGEVDLFFVEEAIGVHHDPFHFFEATHDDVEVELIDVAEFSLENLHSFCLDKRQKAFDFV